jgi:glycosyltransferase involved in cell wall biosynthesis
MEKFSIVIPVRDEVDLLYRTLPSYLACSPDEIILCLDNPAPKDVVDAINKISNVYAYNIKILSVPLNSDYAYAQAWIRRKGFLEAKNDVIVTGDIDLLIVPQAVRKAVELIKDDIAIVALQKMTYPHNFFYLFRGIVREFRRRTGVTSNTGLYVFYRPYWLETEKDLARGMQSLKGRWKKQGFVTPLEIIQSGYMPGEDTHLRLAMEKKYTTLRLKDIGAIDLQMSAVDRPDLQFNKGFFYSFQTVVSNRSKVGIFLRVVLTTVSNLYPYWLLGYFSFLKVYRRKDLDKWKEVFNNMDTNFGGFVDILRRRLSKKDSL